MSVWTLDLPYLEPFEACAAFGQRTVVALLDSTGPAHDAGGCSYLAVDPYRVLEVRDGVARVDGRASAQDPFATIAGELACAEVPPDPHGFAFRGGAVAAIGYEFGARRDAIAVASAEPGDPPDLFVGFHDLVVGFDAAHRLCRAHATGLPATGAGRASRARARLEWVRSVWGRAPVTPRRPLPALDWVADWDRPGYAARLRRLHDYIGAGDIFQANLTLRHTADRPPGLAAAAVFGALRAANPAPFGAWLRCGAFDLCCSSPERFLRVWPDGRIETRPIKGTIARDADPVADARAAAELLTSAKDRAENVMIVDVLRHDLGRVAALGSVAVPALCALESYATVHHLVSRVTGRLRAGATAIDTLAAALPGGSVTGAPKIRAMQIIAELEASRRGLYCGSVAWLGHDGAMDSNIVIRSLVLTRDRVIAGAGGGIVADSEAGAEYDEMMLKAAPMLGIFGQ